ncbi:MAG TPA: sugar phosphate isomerase/epimerase family protein [Cyclobacteriaceae bacterium]|nr:sugar phosphate isomerase/epimerase family protein [Cyclobacteriaceae bacterium]
MLRRDFIASASLLAGGLITAPFTGNSESLSQQTAMPKLKKSLGYGMIQEDIPLLDKLKLVKDLGYDGVEFNSPVDVNLKELVAAKEQTGILLPSTVNKDHWSKPLSDPDPSGREFIINSITRSLEETKELGGDTVLVVPGVVNEKVSYETAFNTALESIRKLIPAVERTGVRIGLENVWNNFILSPMEAKNLVDTINHPLIGFYFDIGNVLRYGWPEHWIETLNSRIIKLHIKEFSRKKMNDEGLWKGFDVELTEGDIDWAAVMTALRKTNYKGEWITAEVKGGDRKRLAQVSEQMDKIISM